MTGSGTGLGVGGITGTQLSIASLSSKPKPPPGPPIDINSLRLGGITSGFMGIGPLGNLANISVTCSFITTSSTGIAADFMGSNLGGVGGSAGPPTSICIGVAKLFGNLSIDMKSLLLGISIRSSGSVAMGCCIGMGIGLAIGIGSGCIVGGTNGIGSPTGKGLTKLGSSEGKLGIDGNGTGPVTFGESLGISKLGIGSAIDGSLPIDGGLFGNLITGPRGSDGVNFGGIEIFGS